MHVTFLGPLKFPDINNRIGIGLWGKDFRAFGVADIRRMTAATAPVTLARLFTEWLCYVTF